MKERRLTITFALGLGLTLAVLLSLFICPPSLSRAANITSVNTTNDGIVAGDGQCTLREAINNANADSDTTGGDCMAGSGDDTISLGAGTYVLTLTGAVEDFNSTGDLDLTGTHALTIAGLGANQTIINAGGIDRVLHVFSGTVVITGVAIAGGNTDQYGGGLYNATADLTLINVLVFSNSARYGGGIYVAAGNTTLIGVDVISNSGRYDGGGLYVSLGRVTLTATDFVSNTAASDGGGVGVGDGQITMEGGEIYNNTASDEGGGIMVDETPAHVVLTGTRIISNSAQDYGGGIYAAQGQVTLSGVQLLSNTAGYLGGGASVGSSGGALTITANSLIAYNRVTDPAVGYGGGGLALDSSTAQLTVQDSQILSNVAHWGGGGVFVTGGNARLERVAVVGNRAFVGGGINHSHYYASSALAIINSTVSQNRAVSGGSGGGIYADQNTTTALTFTTVASNTATGGGPIGGGLHLVPGATLLIQNSLVAYNMVSATARNCSPGITSTGYNLDSANTCGFAATGDITNTNPLLDALAEENDTRVHPLLADSPAIDKGLCVAGIATDQRGQSRPDFGCDIGAYEVGGAEVYLPIIQR